MFVLKHRRVRISRWAANKPTDVIVSNVVPVFFQCAKSKGQSREARKKDSDSEQNTYAFNENKEIKKRQILNNPLKTKIAEWG